MSTLSPQKTAAIAAIKQLEQALREARKSADHAVESYQQEKNKLIMMRTDSDNEIRDIKLQYDNTINQLRQHIARTNRETRRDMESLRRQWLGLPEPKPAVIDATPIEDHEPQPPQINTEQNSHHIQTSSLHPADNQQINSSQNHHDPEEN